MLSAAEWKPVTAPQHASSKSKQKQQVDSLIARLFICVSTITTVVVSSVS